jgi:hypothetical protein
MSCSGPSLLAVPLEEYKQNLRKIVAHIRQLKRDLPVVLMTPPPTYNVRDTLDVPYAMPVMSG